MKYSNFRMIGKNGSNLDADVTVKGLWPFTKDRTVAVTCKHWSSSF